MVGVRIATANVRVRFPAGSPHASDARLDERPSSKRNPCRFESGRRRPRAVRSQDHASPRPRRLDGPGRLILNPATGVRIPPGTLKTCHRLLRPTSERLDAFSPLLVLLDAGACLRSTTPRVRLPARRPHPSFFDDPSLCWSFASLGRKGVLRGRRRRAGK